MRSRHVRRRVAVAVVASAFGLSACGPGSTDAEQVPASAPAEQPRPAPTFAPPTPAPAVPPESVPALVTGAPTWLAPFDDVPYPAGEMLVGMVYPADDEAMLSIIGVDRTGATRWAVRTNPACVGFGVVRAGERSIAVILSSDADNRNGRVATETTASGYDATDGSRVWGPTPVPGPLHGPGLIFGTSAGSVVGGPEGAKVMLSADGRVVSGPAGAVARYEHDGIGLFENAGTLTAVDTATGATLWDSADIPRPAGAAAGAALVETVHAADRGVVAVRWPGAGEATRVALHDLRTGRLITTVDTAEPRTTVDETTGTVLVAGLDGGRHTRAVDLATGETRWGDRDPAGALDVTLTDRGTGFATRGARSVAVDLRSGRTLAEGSWPVPVARSDAGIVIAPLPEPAAGHHPPTTSGLAAYRRS